MSQHFGCTACGRCCYGQLPLAWSEALQHASRFPLAMVWTPVAAGSRDYQQALRLGVGLKLAKRREIAVLVVPTSFLPASLPCPELLPDNRCGIHAEKPQRCKTMPFYPYREERDQADLLTPRQGWLCDTSTAAPLVYAKRKILDRSDFDQELRGLNAQKPLLETYVKYMLQYTPALLSRIEIALSKPKGGHIVTSLSSFLTAIRSANAAEIAQQQLPVLLRYAECTQDQIELDEWHRYYTLWAQEMSYLAAPQRHEVAYEIKNEPLAST